MAEPNVISVKGGSYTLNGEKLRTYNQTMAQYNRLLRRFNEINEAGEYDDAMYERERKVQALVDRYADNIEESKAFQKARAAYRRGEKVNPDNVAVPYSVYAKRRNNRS